MPRARPRAASGAKATDLYALCCRIADRQRVAAGDREIVCRAFGDPRGPWNGQRLEGAVSSFVTSAVEHAPPGTPVTLRVTGHLRHVCLEVHRIGEASPAASSAHLVAAVDAVRALGGMVSMISSSPGASTCTVRLPRA